MAGRVFAMGGAARGLTVRPASTPSRMPWAFNSPPERVDQANVGEQARLDDGLVPR
jgi:hypothetical protein